MLIIFGPLFIILPFLIIFYIDDIVKSVFFYFLITILVGVPIGIMKGDIDMKLVIPYWYNYFKEVKEPIIQPMPRVKTTSEPIILEQKQIFPEIIITEEQSEENTLAINKWMDSIVVPVEKEPTPVLTVNDRVTIIMKNGKKYYGVVTEINFDHLMLRSIQNPKIQIGLEFSKIESHTIS